MRIPFKIKNGKSITVCPHNMQSDGAVIRVGMMDCVKCRHYLSSSYPARLLRCSYSEPNKTYEDGIADCIKILTNHSELSYMDKLPIMNEFKKLIQNGD